MGRALSVEKGLLLFAFDEIDLILIAMFYWRLSGANPFKTDSVLKVKKFEVILLKN